MFLGDFLFYFNFFTFGRGGRKGQNNCLGVKNKIIFCPFKNINNYHTYHIGNYVSALDPPRPRYVREISQKSKKDVVEKRTSFFIPKNVSVGQKVKNRKKSVFMVKSDCLVIISFLGGCCYIKILMRSNFFLPSQILKTGRPLHLRRGI